ncbi:hypothetical protein FRB99_004878 [Tulasnella sp. 403]|nr:hypothetical protein FRB99_004878 [Tulasnella sp. 403]
MEVPPHPLFTVSSSGPASQSKSPLRNQPVAFLPSTPNRSPSFRQQLSVDLDSSRLYSPATPSLDISNLSVRSTTPSPASTSPLAPEFMLPSSAVHPPTALPSQSNSLYSPGGLSPVDRMNHDSSRHPGFYHGSQQPGSLTEYRNRKPSIPSLGSTSNAIASSHGHMGLNENSDMDAAEGDMDVDGDYIYPQEAKKGMQRVYPTAGKVHANNFVSKTFNMLKDPSTKHIHWSNDGRSFIVTNQDAFSTEILPKHFKHSNFASFVRQLNMYDFHKTNRAPRSQRGVEKECSVFSHPKFQRGRPDLLPEIRRKAPDAAGADPGNAYDMPPPAAVPRNSSDELHHLKDQFRTLRSEHDVLVRFCQDLVGALSESGIHIPRLRDAASTLQSLWSRHSISSPMFDDAKDYSNPQIVVSPSQTSPPDSFGVNSAGPSFGSSVPMTATGSLEGYGHGSNLSPASQHYSPTLSYPRGHITPSVSGLDTISRSPHPGSAFAPSLEMPKSPLGGVSSPTSPAIPSHHSFDSITSSLVHREPDEQSVIQFKPDTGLRLDSKPHNVIAK